ncbi:MarR family winged helix-turn-helix transcriptional regulator [Lacticaseibacillus zhaodongensis]|uniref:MarR family winged helix-turn-helix transcriptional regulator n=1 Tax=Lacticaseibacillus zhaodongensis TaxID=2668065 RepID=UPI0012D2E625|nr:MarR family winged helix-turn-helix transcriptional regulator [Lacticaseibacillus zhaodongensis]
MEEKEQNTELLGKLFVTLAQTAFRNTSDDHLKLTHIQLLVLMAVYTNPGIKMSALAADVGISSAQLSRTISKLETAKLVHREHNVHNRRIVNVQRTATGDAVAEKHMQYFKSQVDKQFAVLTSAERRKLNADFKSLLTLLGKAGFVQNDALLRPTKTDTSTAENTQLN